MRASIEESKSRTINLGDRKIELTQEEFDTLKDMLNSYDVNSFNSGDFTYNTY